MASAPTKHGELLIGFKCSSSFTLHKATRDPEGRYLVLMDLLQDTEVTLRTYYAPNTSEVYLIFFREPPPPTSLKRSLQRSVGEEEEGDGKEVEKKVKIERTI